MTTATLGQLIEKHGFDVLDYLDRDLEIPVHAGLQAQGDLFIIPADPDHGSRRGTAVPPDGVAVIEAVNGGHEHRLFAGQPGSRAAGHCILHPGRRPRAGHRASGVHRARVHRPP